MIQSVRNSLQFAKARNFFSNNDVTIECQNSYVSADDHIIDYVWQKEDFCKDWNFGPIGLLGREMFADRERAIIIDFSRLSYWDPAQRLY